MADLFDKEEAIRFKECGLMVLVFLADLVDEQKATEVLKDISKVFMHGIYDEVCTCFTSLTLIIDIPPFLWIRCLSCLSGK